MFDQPATPTLSAHVRRQLGRELAALYDRLPVPPPGPEILALVCQLEARERRPTSERN